LALRTKNGVLGLEGAGPDLGLKLSSLGLGLSALIMTTLKFLVIFVNNM